MADRPWPDDDQQLCSTVDAVRTAYPTKPFLPLFHLPIELASVGPGSRIHRDGRVNFAAVCCGKLL